MRTRTLLAGGVAALGLTAGMLAPATAAPDRDLTRTSAAAVTAAPVYKKYVAMGDSFTAGPLIPWNSTWCFRSNNNYPAWLATDLGLYYTWNGFQDVSCSSADTTNLTRSQPTPTADLHFSTQPPQLDALSPDTDLVTLGMGGNDYTVFGSVITCGEYRDEDPTGSPCRDHFTINGVDTLSAALDNTGRNLEGAVARIKERAPAAKVVLVGYPRLLPPTGYCPDTVPFADGDYAWADYLNRKLNTVMRNAATRKGALYVDTMRAISKLVLKALGASTSTSTALHEAPAGAEAEADLKKQRWARQHADELVPTE